MGLWGKISLALRCRAGEVNTAADSPLNQASSVFRRRTTSSRKLLICSRWVTTNWLEQLSPTQVPASLMGNFMGTKSDRSQDRQFTTIFSWGWAASGSANA